MVFIIPIRITIIAAMIVMLYPELLIAGHIPKNVKDCWRVISEQIYNDNFEKAESIIDSLYTENSIRPFDFLFISILCQSRMMAAESDFLDKRFFDNLDSVENYANKMLEKGGDSALAYYFLGQGHAFRALNKGRAGHTWSAIKSGLGARKEFGKGYKIDSAFHDIALGLGSYRYWKSVKTNIINWTPLIKNEKQNGIELLRRAVDSSDISQEAARSALIWVYINEEQYGQAIQLANEMRQRYPNGLTFIWPLAEIYYKLKAYRRANEYYNELYLRLKDNPGNYYNLIEAAYYLNRCYKEGYARIPGACQKINQLAEEIINAPIPKKIAKRQKKKLKQITKKCD